LFVTGSLKEYLEAVYHGMNAILTMNRAGDTAALAVVATTYQQYGLIQLGHHLSDGLTLNLKPFTG
jgi:predicted regulator of Ras-like GTPase activity (Roadblock/LC7/MglB family)